MSKIGWYNLYARKSRVEEDMEMPYGIALDWIIDFIKDKDEKEEE